MMGLVQRIAACDPKRIYAQTAATLERRPRIVRQDQLVTEPESSGMEVRWIYETFEPTKPKELPVLGRGGSDNALNQYCFAPLSADCEPRKLFHWFMPRSSLNWRRSRIFGQRSPPETDERY